MSINEYVEDESQGYEGNVYVGEPIPVVEFSERFPPEFGGCMTWAVPQFGVGTPVQIFTRRIRRHKGKWTITALAGATAVIVNSNIDHLSIPQGATFLATGFMPDWESQQPMYAIAIGGTATIATIDESYAEKQ